MELKKSYSPEEIEDKWYDTWERNGYFKPDQGAEGSPFCISSTIWGDSWPRFVSRRNS